jgi:site-specific DNA-methyltransferase (adenine-specific)
VATRSSGQDLPRAAYEFVPLQSFDVTWDDQSLYLKYGLDQAEVDLIESLIRPMDAKTDG